MITLTILKRIRQNIQNANKTNLFTSYCSDKSLLDSACRHCCGHKFLKLRKM